jgi:hypothetical protein
MVKLVDTRDLKSLGWKRLCRFESGSGHHKNNIGTSLSSISMNVGPSLWLGAYRDDLQALLRKTPHAL